MRRYTHTFFSLVLFVCLFGFLTSSSTTRLYRGRAPRQERLTILRAATHETELGDHDFCLSQSHHTDTDPTCRERAATAGIEPGTSSPGVARSTAELPRPPFSLDDKFIYYYTLHKRIVLIFFFMFAHKIKYTSYCRQT